MPNIAHGLGCLPSPEDGRDRQIVPLLSAAPVPTDPVFRIWQDGGVPQPLNQYKTPQCVAYASCGVKQYQEIIDEKRNEEYDENWLYRRCKERDGAPFQDGTYLRVALGVLRSLGVPTKGRTDNAGQHKIEAYYAVPVSVSVVKQTLVEFGPVLMGSQWYESWFTPLPNGTLPTPDKVVGGHATYIFGWDDARGFYCRNSWGKGWGPLNGNFMLPYNYFTQPIVHDLWKAVDVKGDGR